MTSHSHPLVGTVDLDKTSLGDRFRGYLLFSVLCHQITPERVATLREGVTLIGVNIASWKELAQQLPAEDDAQASLAHSNLRDRRTPEFERFVEAVSGFRSQFMKVLYGSENPPRDQSPRDVAAAIYLTSNNFKEGYDRLEFIAVQYAAGNFSTRRENLVEWIDGLGRIHKKMETVLKRLEARAGGNN